MRKLSTAELDRLSERVENCLGLDGLSVLHKLAEANRMGNLEALLKTVSLEWLLDRDSRLMAGKRMIMVVGSGCVNVRTLRQIADEESSIDVERFDFRLDYDKLMSFDMRVLEKPRTRYMAVIWGATPHSMKNKGKYSSPIGKIRSNKEKYAFLVVSKDDRGKMRLAKEPFRKAVAVIEDELVKPLL